MSAPVVTEQLPARTLPEEQQLALRASYYRPQTGWSSCRYVTGGWEKFLAT